MKITLIAAIGQNYELGKDNALLWDLPDDMAHFREKTSGKPVIMGRKTYESIGFPLPKRTNIVITRNSEYREEGIQVASSLEEALEIAKKEKPEEVCVIGGAQIYAMALPLATHLSLTIVESSFEADTYFPKFSSEDWELLSAVQHPQDERHEYSFVFEEYKRK